MGRNEPSLDVRRFLRSAAGDSWPAELTDELDEAKIVERLHQLHGSDDTWIASLREQEGWVGDALARLVGRELEQAHRLMQPFGRLLDELAEEAADLGLLGALAEFVLDRRDLEPADRGLLKAALRDAAAAAAQAWARIDQARCLLATIDGGDS
jgi:hypothetical protein